MIKKLVIMEQVSECCSKTLKELLIWRSWSSRAGINPESYSETSLVICGGVIINSLFRSKDERSIQEEQNAIKAFYEPFRPGGVELF